MSRRNVVSWWGSSCLLAAGARAVDETRPKKAGPRVLRPSWLSVAVLGSAEPLESLILSRAPLPLRAGPVAAAFTAARIP